MTKTTDIEFTGEEMEAILQALTFWNDERDSTLASITAASRVDDALDVFYGRTPEENEDEEDIEPWLDDDFTIEDLT